MNYVVITIDALSKWYIDRWKKDGSFFSFLERNTYCFSNMYSEGPFTEAAVRGFWAGDHPLDGYSYLSESRFASERFFEHFSKTHYMYYGRLVPYMNHLLRVDNNLEREKCENRAFEHIWSARLEVFSQLYESGNFDSNDIWMIQIILEDFFEKYFKSSKVQAEKERYYADKNGYVFEILQKGVSSSLYQNLTSRIVEKCKFRNISCIQQQEEHELLACESLFIKKAKNKNIQLAIANEENQLTEVEAVLNGERNRCIVSNNDLLSQMRDENERLPKLRAEIDDFLDWYDTCSQSIDKPFFAYIHNYDFHFPENFMNSQRTDLQAYVEEVEELIREIDMLTDCKISVSKQLCLSLIEKNLLYLWNELEKRDIFRNTCVVITADHGISNFMNPIKKSDSRWNFSRTNFNVPMYIKSPGLITGVDNSLVSSIVFPQILNLIDTNKKVVLNGLVSDSTYIFTAWINGIPDFERNTIKIGIRNQEWSITCEGAYYKSFSSLNILGIYNLQNDPDEIHSVSYESASKEKNFLSLFEKMGECWFDQIKRLLDGEMMRIHANCVEWKWLLKGDEGLLFMRNRRIDFSSFSKLVANRNVIVMGSISPIAVNCLRDLPSTCSISEIWDIHSSNATFFGYKCTKPHVLDDQTVVIVCEENELEAVCVLTKLSVKNYYLYGNIID